MKRLVPILVAALVMALVGALPGTTAQSTNRGPATTDLLNQMAGVAAPKILPNGLPVPQLSGAVQQTVAEQQPRANSKISASLPPPDIGVYGCHNTYQRSGFPDNVRANVDCGYRYQSEEWVAVNPKDPENIVVSQNDSKLNGNSTGVDFSLDGGVHFGDSVLPVRRHTIAAAPGGVWSWDAYSDPSHAWDSRGNLYYTALGFDFAQDGYDGLFVWKSNSCLQGSSLAAPGSGSCKPFSPPVDTSGVAVRSNFDNPALSDDKEMMAADSNPASPYRDSVYITWTIFDFSCPGGSYCESPIYFSKSSDGGVSWSDPLIISGSNPATCSYGNLYNPALDPNACNFSQGSFPVVGPDGTIYVVFNNSNSNLKAVQGRGIAQQLLVKSTDGGTTWTDPVRVGKDHALQPYSVPGNEIPDCPFFRQCLPPNGYRMNDFPSMGIDATTGKLAAFWADFRNGGPCATDPSTKLPVLPCTNMNNDVVMTTSSDGGATWTGARVVSLNGSGGSQPAAQWQPWGDVAENGDLYAGYYDRRYGSCEGTGCNDITLAKSTNDGASWTYQRITTSSMPNLTCAINPFECGFLGDYMGIQAANHQVYLTWVDTRGRNGTTEEDAYFAKVNQ